VTELLESSLRGCPLRRMTPARETQTQDARPEASREFGGQLIEVA
jgi:hypothetical protein